MRRVGQLVLALFWIVGTVAFVYSTAESRQSAVDRGKYLVEEVARCGECHTPRDAQGELDRSRWLQGAPMWFQPVRRMPNWAYLAPRLAGLGGLSEGEVTRVLETGLDPGGKPVRAPMHVYHLSHEDAAAIVAYLKALPAAE
jgi:mono/diheme cytochrome c family protein